MKDLQTQRDFDEILEEMWLCRENEMVENLDYILKNCDVRDIPSTIDEMEKEGLIKRREGGIHFTPGGEESACVIIRRHRLAEVLFKEVFDMEENAMENDACKFEHILSAELTESICSFLGHPPVCPHGKKIPRGNCCNVFKQEICPLITPLTHADIGSKLRVVLIYSERHSHIDKLMTFGITAGKEIRLHQKRPSYVLQIGQTDLAIDEEMAKKIYVKHVT